MRKLLLCLLCLLPVTFSACAEIVISEVMALNGTYKNSHAYDWIELYNSGDTTVSLAGWHLSDNPEKPEKWTFPAKTKLKSGERLLVYCTGDETIDPGKGDTFYAGFKISAKGETLLLTDDNGIEQDCMDLPEQYGTVSYGLAADGSAGYLPEATPLKKNSAVSCTGRAEAPVLTTPGGFYAGSITVHADSTGNITLRYTTDGSTPTEKSKPFPSEGLKLTRTTPVRLRAFSEGLVPSATVSATYLLNDEQLTPIVCLITDDDYLFSKKSGALSKGTGSVPNYDKPYEYPVNIEYYDMNGLCEINQTGTFTVSGHSATVNAQKSIALHARSAYGPDTFAFNPFPHRNYESYHSLLLRAANSDAYATRLRDVVASSLAEGENILYQDALCIQVYINGEYWGHYNLREKINKYMIAQYEGITKDKDIDKIDILSRTGRDEFLQNGSNTDWLALCDFCRDNDLNIPENLARVESELDIDNLFTHAAFQIILGNVDFTNVRLYRVPGGKWKHVLFDVEACWRNLDKTPLEYYIKPVKGKVQGFRHEPLNALLAVPAMKERFLQRTAELLVTCFTWDRVNNAFMPWVETLEQILPRHISRWKNMKLENWRTNIGATRYYARVRPRKIPSLLQKAMKLTKAETEYYFGDALRLLEETNVRE